MDPRTPAGRRYSVRSSGPLPWHTWGSTAPIRLAATSVGQSVTQTVQLVRASYGRPETWSFFLFAKHISSVNGSPAFVRVTYQVTTGVGRSQSTRSTFESYRFNLSIGSTGESTKYSASVIGPARDDSVVSPNALENVISTLTAQDIQIAATCSVQLTNASDFSELEVGAFIAPRTHVRPDWYVDQFTSELDGR